MPIAAARLRSAALGSADEGRRHHAKEYSAPYRSARASPLMSRSDVSPIRERSGKPLLTAIALAFFFGPIGLAYSSRIGAAVMLVVSAAVLVPILLGLHINAVIFLPVWIVCIIWAAFTAGERQSRPPEATLEGEVEADGPAQRSSDSQPSADGAPGRS